MYLTVEGRGYSIPRQKFSEIPPAFVIKIAPPFAPAKHGKTFFFRFCLIFFLRNFVGFPLGFSLPGFFTPPYFFFIISEEYYYYFCVFPLPFAVKFLFEIHPRSLELSFAFIFVFFFFVRAFNIVFT